ncbi:MAG: dihydrolipoyl dehydrogenase [Chloroflexi bacterium]|nr:dihydrolipoyl dehydrogenase [Chloroflexota bacterium]
MKKYDAIVVGSGCGMIIVDEALNHGLKVALVDKGPFGGTCLNLGCIPSKMLIYPADRVVEIEEARKLGIRAKVTSVDFGAIMRRMRNHTGDEHKRLRHDITHVKNLDFYEGVGHFVADYTMAVNGERIKSDRIFLASGSRPFIPPIKGVDSVDYLTSETVLQLGEKPESLIIIGGGYVAVEYGHFFAAMGTKVTILEMADRLILSEEPEIARVLQKELSKRMDVFTNTQAEEAKGSAGGVTVMVKDRKTGAQREVTAQRLLIAVGRASNADLLKLENTGVETDKRSFIKVDDYLETTKRHIYAVGDANGQQMFTHIANREAQLVANNVLHDAKEKMDYSAAPHAVFSHPQIASVGLTEENARKDHEVLVGVARYLDVALGGAMLEKAGLAKVIVEKDSGKILGFHIIGPHASILIQEVINAMASKLNIAEMARGIHIHPALTELIPATFNSIEEV